MMNAKIGITPFINSFRFGISVCFLMLSFSQSVHAINGYASGWCPFDDGVNGGTTYTGVSHLDVVKKCEERGNRVAGDGTIFEVSLTAMVAQGTTAFVSYIPGFENEGRLTSWSYNWTTTYPDGNIYTGESSIGATERFCLPNHKTQPNGSGGRPVDCVPSNCPAGETWDYVKLICGPDPKQDLSCPNAGTNPINVITGNKNAIESDVNSSDQKLGFRRYYSSGTLYAVETAFGGYWRHEYEKRISVNLADNIATVQDGSGAVVRFLRSATVWIAEADGTSQLVELVDGLGDRTGWQYTTSDNKVETYDAFGFIQSVYSIDDYNLTFHYDLPVGQGGDDYGYTLDKISDSFGREITFAYDGFTLTQMTNSDGQIYRYEYDASDRLSQVVYPDDTPADPNDNPKRTYHYEDTNFPNALTGITDENDNRFSTWSYDSVGRAKSSEHDPGSGIDKVTIDFTYIDDPVDKRVTVTNALGKDTTYHYTTLHGVRKVTQVEGHASANCVAANQNYTYDANGFLDEVTDWENNVTDYDHDVRGLEVQRIEAKGTPEERTITTQWHTDFRLPIKITEPDRVIDFTYDASGQLLERKETPITP